MSPYGCSLWQCRCFFIFSYSYRMDQNGICNFLLNFLLLVGMFMHIEIQSRRKKIAQRFRLKLFVWVSVFESLKCNAIFHNLYPKCLERTLWFESSKKQFCFLFQRNWKKCPFRCFLWCDRWCSVNEINCIKAASHIYLLPLHITKFDYLLNVLAKKFLFFFNDISS